MKICFGVLGSTLLFLGAVSCTGSRTIVVDGQTLSTTENNNNTNNTASCSGSLSATMIPVGGISLANIRTGDTINWMVTASGCSNNYILITSGGESISFTPTTPAIFPITYNNITTINEQVIVKALDGSGNVIFQITINGGTFTVSSGSTHCVATTASPSFFLSLDSNNNPVAPVTIPVLVVNSSTGVGVTQVLDNGVAVPATQVVPTLPTSAAQSQVIQIQESAVGTRVLRFNVVDSSGRTGSCETSVSVAGLLPPTPTISSLTATPTIVGIGQPVTLQLTATGTVTRARIDGQAVTLNNGVATYTYVPTRTGRITIEATVENDSSSVNQSVAIHVNPACVIRAVTGPASLPGLIHAQVDITGSYIGATVAGSGITSVSLPAGNTATNLAVNIPMISSPTPLNLTVYGPDNTESFCSTVAAAAPVQLPAPSLTVNGSSGNTTAKIKSNLSICWSSPGATACELKVNGAVLSTAINGTQTVNNIQSDQNVELTCSNSAGPVTKKVLVTMTGRWYQASNAVSCSSVCASQGLYNRASPEGAYCTSGENKPASALADGILYPYGINFAGPDSNTYAASVYTSDCRGTGTTCCYKPSNIQPHDRDVTDWLTGCYCTL